MLKKLQKITKNREATKEISSIISFTQKFIFWLRFYDLVHSAPPAKSSHVGQQVGRCMYACMLVDS